ncbi:MAG: TetR/AcrR family transcriptional regulator [Myxococcota bacterium]|nr:TetR/AcrR family transcriptional regulator [Myxococcota bacterium]
MPGNRRGNEKRRLLVRAVREVIQRIGPRKTTLEDIAEQARVSRSTVYYHFPNKGEMFRAVIDHEISALQDELAGAIRPDASPDECLRTYVRTRAGQVRRLLALYQVTTDMAGEYMAMARSRVDDFHEAERGLLAGLLRAGRDSGRFALRDPDLLASALQATLQGLFDLAFYEGRDVPEDDLDALVRTLIRGILTDPPAEPPC